MEAPPPIALPARPFPDPFLQNARRNIPINVVDENNILHQEQAYLICDSQNPAQCYQRWPKKSQPLGDRGEVLFCQVLLRDRSDSHSIVFQKSDMTVAIKKLRRWNVDPLLARGETVNENPYNEIHVMQQYGDYQHVMQCYEALEDKHYLYIVMLFMRQGDLHSHVQHGLGGGYQPRQEIPVMVNKIVQNLQYMKHHHLVHRDLKPENIMVKTPWLPFIDFAMTLQSAVMEGNSQDILGQGAAGSPSYISPEVFANNSFNRKVDIWALGCIVWNLLTGLRLYELPIGTDDSFTFFIQMGALNNEAMCEWHLEDLLRNDASHELVPRIQAVQVLSDIERDLLSRLLQENPNNRPSLEEILEHPFFHQP